MASGFMQRFRGKIKAAEIYLDSSATKGIFLDGGALWQSGAYPD